MSTTLVERTVCDICGDSDIANQRHYEISLREYSTINCDYFPPHKIHICKSHEAEKIPYNLLFEPTTTNKGETR